MGFSEVSSSGLTAMQIRIEQTRCNFEKVLNERVGRAVAPHWLAKVTQRQSSRKRVLWFGKFWLSELFANFLFHAAFPSLLRCYKVMEITCRVLATWEYVSLSLCTADANAPASSTALFTTSSRATNKTQTYPFPVSQPEKRHKWPLQENNSLLILVLWQVHHRKRSRNTEGTNSCNLETWHITMFLWKHSQPHTWFVHEYLTRPYHLASLVSCVEYVPVWVWTEGLIDPASPTKM